MEIAGTVSLCGILRKGVFLKICYIIIQIAIWFTVRPILKEITDEMRNEGTNRLTVQRPRLFEVIPKKVRFQPYFQDACQEKFPWCDKNQTGFPHWQTRAPRYL